MLTFRIVQVFLAPKTSSILSNKTHFWKLILCLLIWNQISCFSLIFEEPKRRTFWYKFKNACKQISEKCLVNVLFSSQNSQASLHRSLISCFVITVYGWLHEMMFWHRPNVYMIRFTQNICLGEDNQNIVCGFS